MYDRYVQQGVGCHGYPCPVFIKIFNSKLSDVRFNGYYVLSYPLNCKYRFPENWTVGR